jgi:hypothetical protein
MRLTKIRNFNLECVELHISASYTPLCGASNVSANIAVSIVRGADTLESLQHSMQLIPESKQKT